MCVGLQPKNLTSATGLKNVDIVSGLVVKHREENTRGRDILLYGIVVECDRPACHGPPVEVVTLACDRMCVQEGGKIDINGFPQSV